MEEINKWLQDLDPKSSPHKEEEWIGGVVDLDLLFQNPQEWARIMGGIKRGSKFFKVNNGREREEELHQPKVEEGLFIAQAEI